MSATQSLSSKVVDRPFFKAIGYSSCWEDPLILQEALQVVAGDEVLSITSGGCNTLGMLLEDPQRVVAIDFNGSQSHLLRLKIAAIKSLDHGELLELVGVRASSRRAELYAKLRGELEPEAREWWDERPRLMANGLYRIGRTDRYLMAFGNLVRLLFGRQKVERMFGFDTVEAQREFYDGQWDGRVWRGLFDVFFHRQVITRAKDPEHFRFADFEGYGKRFLARTEPIFRELPLWDNYFMGLILLGRYPSEHAVPPYLHPDSLPLLRERVGRIEIRTGELERLLTGSEPGSFNRFNLSNLFDWVSDEHLARMLREVRRISRPQGRLCYWNTLVPRPLPELEGIVGDRPLAEALLRRDRFIYAHLEIASIS